MELKHLPRRRRGLWGAAAVLLAVVSVAGPEPWAQEEDPIAAADRRILT